MEILTALLTAAFAWLFLWHMATKGRTRARQRLGPLLLRISSRHSRFWFIAGLVVLGVLVVGQTAFLFWIVSIAQDPIMIFNWCLLTFNLGSLPFAVFPVLEFRQRGILQGQGLKSLVTPWTAVHYCKWPRAPGKLLVQLHQAIQEFAVPAGQQAAVTAALERVVEVRDVDGRVLNPNRPESVGNELPPAARFQFDLQDLLLFVLVASSAMSWYGIRYRAAEAESRALATFAPLCPTVQRDRHSLQLDFSKCPNKPGNDDLACIAALSRLGSLNLSGAPITDEGLTHLSRLTMLSSLDISDTQVTDPGLADLRGLTRLTSLDLSHTRVTDAGLAELETLSNLEYLHLSQTSITDEGMVHLEKLTKLRSLWLMQTKVTKAGAERLRRALPDCSILHW